MIQFSKSGDKRPHSRGGFRPSLAAVLPSKNREGAGNAGRLAAPAASRAKTKKAHEHSYHRSAARHGIPCAMVLRLMACSPRSAGLVSLRRLAGSSLARLDASVGVPGPHDFAVHARLARPARWPRPSHPASHVRDDRDTPLDGGGTGADNHILTKNGRKIFFVTGLDLILIRRITARRFARRAELIQATCRLAPSLSERGHSAEGHGPLG